MAVLLLASLLIPTEYSSPTTLSESGPQNELTASSLSSV